MAEITKTSTVTGATADDSSKTIVPGLRADVMRKLMETKNTLTKKGSIYVGTGNKETVTIGSDTCDICETARLDPPTTSGLFLMSDSTDGVKYSDLGSVSYGSTYSLPVDGSKPVFYSNYPILSGQGVYTPNGNYVRCGNYVSLYSDKNTYNGYLALGQSNTANGTLSVYSQSRGDYIRLNGATGGISTWGAVEASSFDAKSDRRLKENISDYECGKSILDLPVKRFDFVGGPKNQIGCIAQDLREICPEIVSEDKDGYLSIKESKIVYLLLQEVRKLRAEMDELKGGR